MKGTQVHVAPITCKFFNLTSFTAKPDAEYPETILKPNEPFSLRVTVEFGGAGVIALMPLLVCIKVNFFAEPYGLGSKSELGDALVTTSAGLFTYTPTLKIAKPEAVGLVPDAIYNISAVLRVGASNGPALITGFTDGLALQIYVP